MTIKGSTKYGIVLVGALSLLILGSLVLSDSSHDNIKLANSVEEPLFIPISSSIVKCTHEDLNNYSDMIVIGTVNEILPSKWNTIDGNRPDKANSEFSQGDLIYTDIIINVDKYLKNSLSSKEIVVRVIGGTVGNDTVTSDVEPSFKSGEKVLLYLSKDTSPMTNVGSEHFLVYGSLQGKFTLTDDGKAVRPDETTTLDELLSTIKE